MTLRLGLACACLLLALSGASTALSRPTSCIYQTEKQHRAQADVVFGGIFLRGPATRGMLLSPARFRVVRYLKGRGPRRVRVQTAVRKLGGDTYVWMSEGIDPRAGERWRIYGFKARNGVVRTSLCAGSGRLGFSPA
jgi:hypothetical protein